MSRVIDRFKDRATRDLWEGRSTKAARRAVPLQYHSKTRLRLDFVLQAATVASFRALPPGADFKELRGVARGTYQLRIAGPYRIRFTWSEEGAYELHAGDFHDED
jgi:toxin HigB-1